MKLAYYLYSAGSRKTASREFREVTLAAFRGFLGRGNYSSDLHGVDVGDLIYWESRMANWAALQISAHAVGVNAHAGLNSRKLFRTFWGIEGELRYAKLLNKEILRHYDPVLAAL